ncbi:MAG: glycosyltransferase family 4 protein [Patescibacteria group bacterium]|nr:glycosyltransferase family 4 protein [Patescibacteria group bacterium]MCL5431581.1 glycosyltransferase family 4 protein [Patescibacteria group bacterium]
MRILSIGLDRALFDQESDTFWRVSTYASWFVNYTVIVTTLKSEKRKEFSQKSLRVIPTNSTIRLLYPLDVLRIAWQNRKESFDLVTVQDPFICAIAGVLVKFLLHIPLNIQVHSEFFNSKYFREESKFNRILYYIGLATTHFADTIRARNRRIAAYFKNRKTFYVAAPINPIYLRPLSRAKRDKNLIISVGRDVPQKNFALLREAVGMVKKKFPGVRLEIVTGGKSSAELKRLYEHAGVFILSSNHEGWGLVVLEALARGCPVVMTDTGCAREIVIDGRTGYVAPVGNARALAQKIILTLGDYQHSLAMAKDGRNLVTKDCSFKTIKKQTVLMYEATLHH